MPELDHLPLPTGCALLPLPPDPGGGRLGPIQTAMGGQGGMQYDPGPMADRFRLAPFIRCDVWCAGPVRLILFAPSQPGGGQRAKYMDLADGGAATLIVPRASSLGAASILSPFVGETLVDVSVSPAFESVPWHGVVTEEGTLAPLGVVVVPAPPQGSLSTFLQASGALTVASVMGLVGYLNGNVGPGVNLGNPVDYGPIGGPRQLQLTNFGGANVNWGALMSVEM